MLSYASNREDVVLDRVFPHRSPGFYIDVGANHPVAGSVTAHFYLNRGWRGINVEPSEVFHELSRARVGDINLNCALSSSPGETVLYEFPGATGLSTVSSDAARAAEARLNQVSRARRVPLRTLADICAEHVRDTIDFLSVDVEGHEFQVLSGGDWSRFRPRVVLVEATEPYSPTPNHQKWEPILLSANYLFATFDGLNRFYVRAEDRDLLPLLTVPANVLDDYLSLTEHQALAEVDRLRQLLATAAGLGPLAGAVVRRIGRLESRFPRVSNWLLRTGRWATRATSAVLRTGGASS